GHRRAQSARAVPLRRVPGRRAGRLRRLPGERRRDRHDPYRGRLPLRGQGHRLGPRARGARRRPQPRPEPAAALLVHQRLRQAPRGVPRSRARRPSRGVRAL
ncbi:MAG: hypothetical protein AVDCRST_MAG38-2569, partial [uncultured Solirubrobacteraceae bacterium]